MAGRIRIRAILFAAFMFIGHASWTAELRFVDEVSLAPGIDSMGVAPGGRVALFVPIVPRIRMHLEGASFARPGRESDSEALAGAAYSFSYDAINSVYAVAGMGYDNRMPGSNGDEPGYFGYGRLGTHVLVWDRKVTYSPYLDFSSPGRGGFHRGRVEFLNFAYVF